MSALAWDNLPWLWLPDREGRQKSAVQWRSRNIFFFVNCIRTLFIMWANTALWLGCTPQCVGEDGSMVSPQTTSIFLQTWVGSWDNYTKHFIDLYHEDLILETCCVMCGPPKYVPPRIGFAVFRMYISMCVSTATVCQSFAVKLSADGNYKKTSELSEVYHDISLKFLFSVCTVLFSGNLCTQMLSRDL